VGCATTGTTLDAFTAAQQLERINNENDDTDGDDDDGCQPLPDNTLHAATFRRTVKLLYSNESAAVSSSIHGNDQQRPDATVLDWTRWTRFDACCVPNSGNNNNNNNNNDSATLTSSADAYLPCIGIDGDEFLSLERELGAASALIPSEIAAATARAKLETGADVAAVRLAAIVV
jgi:hypothetical protein